MVAERLNAHSLKLDNSFFSEQLLKKELKVKDKAVEATCGPGTACTASESHPVAFHNERSTKKGAGEVPGKGTGKEGLGPQEVHGSKKKSVLMAASEILIFWVEIQGSITLRNSVGNTNCYTQKIQCENSDI